MIANALTALRLLLIGPLVWGIARPGALAVGGLLACVLAGIASDFFDGKAARRYGTLDTAASRNLISHAGHWSGFLRNSKIFVAEI